MACSHAVCGDEAKPGVATRSRRKLDLVRTLTQAGQKFI